MNRYSAIKHVNSMNSRRRGLLQRFNNLTGKMEPTTHVTLQIIRAGSDGSTLPHVPFLVKRNRYTPHVGKKQLAKQKTRNHVAA